MLNFTDFPLDILRLVCSWLDTVDILNLSRVSKWLNLTTWGFVKKLVIRNDNIPWNLCRKMTKITSINLNSCNKVDQEEMDILGEMKGLKKLYMNEISIDVIIPLSKFPDLKILNLYDCNYLKGFDMISGSKKLVKLCLNKCRLTDKEFNIIPTLKSLQKLYIWNTGAKDKHVVDLSQLTNLDTLDISSNNLT